MANLSHIFTLYKRRVESLKQCCSRIESQAAHKSLHVADRDLLYESILLTATAVFEHLLEDLLVEMVCGPPSTHPGHFPLLRPKSRAAFRHIYLQGQGYVSMLPYNNTIRMADLYLNGGLPFTLVANPERDLLSQAIKIRHAVAHRSKKAYQEFRAKVPGVQGLPQNRRFPGPFLRTIFRANPTQSRLDLYLNNLVQILHALTTSW